MELEEHFCKKQVRNRGSGFKPLTEQDQVNTHPSVPSLPYATFPLQRESLIQSLEKYVRKSSVRLSLDKCKGN